MSEFECGLLVFIMCGITCWTENFVLCDLLWSTIGQHRTVLFVVINTGVVHITDLFNVSDSVVQKSVNFLSMTLCCLCAINSMSTKTCFDVQYLNMLQNLKNSTWLTGSARPHVWNFKNYRYFIVISCNSGYQMQVPNRDGGVKYAGFHNNLQKMKADRRYHWYLLTSHIFYAGVWSNVTADVLYYEKDSYLISSHIPYIFAYRSHL